jgi:hypothetical protein
VGGRTARYCGSVSGVVNAADHLWWVNLGPGGESNRVNSFWFARPPLLLRHADTWLEASVGLFVAFDLLLIMVEDCPHRVFPRRVASHDVENFICSLWVVTV